MIDDAGRRLPWDTAKPDNVSSYLASVAEETTRSCGSIAPSSFGQEGEFQKISDGDFHMTPDTGATVCEQPASVSRVVSK